MPEKGPLVKKVIQVDVLALIQRYSTEQGVQLHRGQQSLIELGSKPETNFDPIMLVLIAHFFENLPAEDVDNMPDDQKAALKTLQKFSKHLTTQDVQKKLAEAHKQACLGKVGKIDCDMNIGVDIEENKDDIAKLKANPDFAKALAIMNDAKQNNRPLRQDEINTVFNLLGRDMVMTKEMWEHALNKMVADKKMDKADKDAILARIAEQKDAKAKPGTVNLEGLEKHLAPKLKAHTDPGAETGKIYMESNAPKPKSTKEPTSPKVPKDTKLVPDPVNKKTFFSKGTKHISVYGNGVDRGYGVDLLGSADKARVMASGTGRQHAATYHK